VGAARWTDGTWAGRRTVRDSRWDADPV